MQAEIWAVCEWHNCSGEDVVDLDGTPVVALCATKQLADQVQERLGYGYVQKMDVATTMKQAIPAWS